MSDLEITKKLSEPIGTVVSSKTIITVDDEGNNEIERVVVAELNID